MDPCRFPSDLPPEELRRRFLRLLEELGEERRAYALRELSPGIWEVRSSATTGEHLGARRIADFISEAIRRGERALLVLRALTGEAWGFLIERERVRRVRWVPVVENEDGSLEFLKEVET